MGRTAWSRRRPATTHAAVCHGVLRLRQRAGDQARSEARRNHTRVTDARYLTLGLGAVDAAVRFIVQYWNASASRTRNFIRSSALSRLVIDRRRPHGTAGVHRVSICRTDPTTLPSPNPTATRGRIHRPYRRVGRFATRQGLSWARKCRCLLLSRSGVGRRDRTAHRVAQGHARSGARPGIRCGRRGNHGFGRTGPMFACQA
jgi:hypothetical protein